MPGSVHKYSSQLAQCKSSASEVTEVMCTSWEMSPSDFMTERQAALAEFLDSSFLADVHIRSAKGGYMTSALRGREGGAGWPKK